MDEEVYSHPRFDRRRLALLGRRSDAKGLQRLAAHVATLVATGGLLYMSLGTWWAVPATALYGAVLIFLFSALHECVHRTAFRSRWLNDWVAWAAGALLLLPPEFFRYFHFAHHRFTQDPALDPELATPKPASFPAWLLHVSGLPVWRWLAATAITHALGRAPEAYLPAQAGRRVVREARALIGLYALVAIASVALGSAAAVYYWIVPALAGQPLLRIFLLAEHTGCPETPDMLKNTRTTLSNAAVRFYTWNMPYHAEHHAFPSLPFHALPAAHLELAPELGVVASGYLAVQRGLLRSF